MHGSHWVADSRPGVHIWLHQPGSWCMAETLEVGGPSHGGRRRRLFNAITMLHESVAVTYYRLVFLISQKCHGSNDVRTVLVIFPTLSGKSKLL
jgi:hypothetical protein